MSKHLGEIVGVISSEQEQLVSVFIKTMHGTIVTGGTVDHIRYGVYAISWFADIIKAVGLSEVSSSSDLIGKKLFIDVKNPFRHKYEAAI